MLKVSRILLAETPWSESPSPGAYEQMLMDKDYDEEELNNKFLSLGSLTPQDVQSGKLSELLKGLPKQKAVRNLLVWADKFCKYKGSGTSRVTYQLDDNHALKIAKNGAGIAQNRVESHVAQNLHDLPITQVHFLDPQGLFLLVDFAHELDPENFKETFGVSFDKFRDICEYYEEGPYQKKKILSEASDALRRLILSLEKHGVILYELADTDQWGDLKNKPVIVDYGFTQDVRREYYN